MNYDSLSPYISQRTLLIHYEKHYLNYLNNLKKLTSDDPVFAIKNINKYNIKDRAEIIYNAGGVLNHELYFISMNKNNSMPSFKLLEAINKKYGSYDNFKKEFIKIASKLVGSGYTFLVINNNGIDIINLPNQDSPYMYNMIPLLALDLWEHSYYLDYQNKRNEYINNFFQIVDFNFASNLYEKNV